MAQSSVVQLASSSSDQAPAPASMRAGSVSAAMTRPAAAQACRMRAHVWRCHPLTLTTGGAKQAPRQVVMQ